MGFQGRAASSHQRKLHSPFARCLVLIGYSLNVVMINRSHRELALFHSLVFYGHSVSSNIKLQ